MAELVLCDGLECEARTLDRGVVTCRSPFTQVIKHTLAPHVVSSRTRSLLVMLAGHTTLSLSDARVIMRATLEEEFGMESRYVWRGTSCSFFRWAVRRRSVFVRWYLKSYTWSVQEPVLEDCMVCWTLVLACGVSQTEEGKVRRELLDPVSSGRRRYAYAKLFANASEYLGEGVESVIPRERLNDDPHRVGAVLRGEWREPAFAERAPEQLHRSVLGGANAVFGKVGAFAVWAHDRGFGGAARGVVRVALCRGSGVRGRLFLC